MDHDPSLLAFPPYFILIHHHQAFTQYAASLLCRKLFSYLPQRKETQSSISIFVLIVHELQVICSHSHLFWVWFLTGLVTCVSNYKLPFFSIVQIYFFILFVVYPEAFFCRILQKKIFCIQQDTTNN